MDNLTIGYGVLVTLIVVALVFDFMNGFHDAANSIATIVSTRVLKPQHAVLWAAAFNFLAYFLFHLKVASTIGTGTINPGIVDHYVIFGALIGAISWNIITWYYGIPSSSSHALVCGLVGAAEIKAGVRAEVPRLNSGLPSKDTTHVSVVDRDGNCVTMTHSLGMPSGVITEGLGFFYNGCMGVFDPRPGRVGSIAPGKARFTSVCPSIVFRDGKPYLVIGAPGATQIAMGVLQAILNVIDFGMTMTEAVSAPRFSATSNAIDVSNRVVHGVTRKLEADGYEVIRSPYTFGFAAVHGIRIDGDRLDGGADPGHDGIALPV